MGPFYEFTYSTVSAADIAWKISQMLEGNKIEDDALQINNYVYTFKKLTGKLSWN